MAPPRAEGAKSRTPVGFAEALLVVLLTAAALAARAWAVGATGITQYDEGVYAFSGLGLTDPSQPHRLWPMQERFAPPVYIALVALADLIGGPSEISAIAVNVVLGTLTVPVVWWVARRWFGPAAGVAAAALLAFSEFHIIMSRVALTDVAFVLAFLLAIAALVRALEAGTVSWAVAAGVAVGVAWNTKYHGWFALIIAVGIVAGRRLFGAADAAETRRAARTVAIAGAVAGLLYVPWMIFIATRQGSVGGWSEYFAGMLSVRWLRNLGRHAEQQFILDGPLSRAAVPVAMLCALIAQPGSRPRRAWGVIAGGFVGAVALGAAGTATLLALVAAPRLLRAGSVAVFAVLAWLGLWVVAAPAYRPYFRLLLPYTVATFIVAGAWLAEALRPAQRDAPAGSGADRGVGGPMASAAALRAAAAAAVVLLGLAASRLPRWVDPWRPTDGVRRAAAEIAGRVPAGAAVRVVGEPTVAFYLHRAGRPSFGDVIRPSELDTLGPGYLVIGLYARRSSAFRAALGRRGAEAVRLGSFPMMPSDLRLLDDFPPAAARRLRSHPDSSYALELYRLGAGP